MKQLKNPLRQIVCVFGMALALSVSKTLALEPLTGNIFTHDPSTMIKDGSRYYIFFTGQNISSKSSADKLNWTSGPTVFSSATRPAWTTTAVPGFTGTFWAPDIIHVNGQFYLYYSVSTFGSQISAIGLATNPTLDPSSPDYLWTDQGPVIQSNSGVNYNTIDPSVMLASDGRMWMSFGSYWTGIKLIELDPATGKRISGNSPVYSLATHPPSTAIEGSCLIQHGDYFYLFVNWDTCCSGIDSTYNIRVGRSASVTGPYVDRNGLNMTFGGGTMFLESSGRYIGPGHAGVMVEGETNWLTFHYYDGNANGVSKLALGRLQWTSDDWPVITNDWTAFYPFEADARDDSRQYNGQLVNGATVVDEPNRSKVLNLDGANNFVSLPISVANADTFAAWVKWNGGDAWQRIFDFGDGTSRYFFLTPSNGENGKLRFAINAGSGEKIIDGDGPLPIGAWQHVAVTLDGSRGLLYLNGNPIATNANLTIRPWQILARSNYLGESQFSADPLFNGQLDSFRVFGRALSADEIKEIAFANPSLSHRYSFTADASDSIGMAHGTLSGNAIVTNNALVLTGVPGGYVNLPGGLVSGSSAATIEFWASFGDNGNWARVFDFGNISGNNGQNFYFFSPHTSANGLRLGASTASGTVNFDLPGTFDNQKLHVVCITDPSSGYTAIYTNGVLLASQIAALPALTGVSAAWSFIGRSLFSGDAWLNATIDEFRIYDGRLTPDEISANDLAGPDALTIPVHITASNSPAGLTLRWSAYAAGFVLESATSLNSETIWNPVVSKPILENDAYEVTLPASATAQFFRLVR